MIKKQVYIIISTCFIFLSGCNGRVILENVSLILLIGVDKAPEGNLIVGTSTALFKTKNGKNTTEELVEAPSMYSGFSKMDVKTTGLLTSAKAEVLLVGKNLAQKNHWVNELDPLLRDPYSSSNIQILLVNGTIKEIFNLKVKESDSLPMHIKKLIHSSIHDNRTVSTSIQELNRQQNEEGMTQTMPLIKREKDKIRVEGIGFLNNKGRYVTHMAGKDVPLYNLLNNKNNRGRMIFHITLNRSKNHQHQIVTALVENAKRKINVAYKGGKFHFDIDIGMDLSIIERTHAKSSMTVNKQQQETIKLEHQIKEQVNKQLMNIINKMQKHELDPLGLSMYAKAYQYKEWETTKKDWVKVLSKSDIHITTDIKIQNIGVIR
ncbi:Ger(x)C family spore germination protein [Bacillus sp. DX1.1]|uniref:Ger(x)C family spore germination protein n=1 Tax=unclassified Bacillus (in: firmicutes) TaxID=185979 RepID=UPI002570F606|nr:MULTISPECIES: Ger(x)C family spore germination protein [unclassified Bacillus (in: firmicutes)]MDM5155303.1 Ger(x)C family spore germination protein [Bacillus sp. DX1.1]WJE79621.1 Ger(x)C family spore germination protein [Bacillus sp. DX3.1]